MKVLLQRVSEASVEVAGERLAAIGPGLLLLVGVERGDGEAEVRKVADRLLHYRVFADGEGKMNLNVQQVRGELLLVSQFTLAADTTKGRRPGFSAAAEPQLAARLCDELSVALAASGLRVATGRFAADMQVSLVNDGPVTFML